MTDPHYAQIHPLYPMNEATPRVAGFVRFPFFRNVTVASP